ncbi:MAG: alpha-hydroxy-acid oxidizing protein [Conexivisphaerales archaeon]
MAKKKLGDEKFSYVSSGAGYGLTIEENYRALERLKFVPRVMKSADCSISSKLFEKTISAPIILAPVRGLKYFHEEGEIASSSAAKESGIPVALSNFASASIEEVGKIMGEVPHFLQLYACKDEEVMESFLKRAESNGYCGVFVTVDMGGNAIKYFGPKTAEYERYGFDVYFTDPVFRSRLKQPPEKDMDSAIRLWKELRSLKFSWEQIRELKSKSRLPIIVKGIMHPGDAEECLQLGVDGLVVSNHGGRSIDSAQAAIDALPEISEVVNKRATVFFDSGVRTGMDVVKALALGAKYVLIGRAYVYALAAGGKEGVKAVLRRLAKEVESTILSLGISKIDEVDSSMLRHA